MMQLPEESSKAKLNKMSVFVDSFTIFYPYRGSVSVRLFVKAVEKSRQNF